MLTNDCLRDLFHLAGVVSGAAEADFDLGMRGNVDGTRVILEHARRHRTPPMLVFSGKGSPAGVTRHPFGKIQKILIPNGCG